MVKPTNNGYSGYTGKVHVIDMWSMEELEVKRLSNTAFIITVSTATFKFPNSKGSLYWRALRMQSREQTFFMERFSIECRKYFRVCFGFALLRSVIG